jgi:hypothetical protein
MIAVQFALLLLVAPVVSQPDAPPQERKLWWNKFWSGVTDWWNGAVETGKKVWDSLELDVLFPSITKALDKVIDACTVTFEDIGSGVQLLLNYSTSFWKDTTEGLAGKDAIQQILQIIKNVDDLADCSLYTFEYLMDVQCDIDRPAFISALQAIHSKFNPIVTLVNVGECENGVQALEVEFDIKIDTQEGLDSVPEFKKALEKFKPSEEASLTAFLTNDQPDQALSTEPSFCEAYEAGRKEFEEATENVATLAEEVAELVEAATEEGKAAGNAIKNFFQRFINIFKKDPVQEKKEAKEAELEAAKKTQAHGANTILGASEMCAEGTMRGPLTKETHEHVCSTDGGRRLRARTIVV